jgi:hypothetical protein
MVIVGTNEQSMYHHRGGTLPHGGKSKLQAPTSKHRTQPSPRRGSAGSKAEAIFPDTTRDIESPVRPPEPGNPFEK